LQGRVDGQLTTPGRKPELQKKERQIKIIRGTAGKSKGSGLNKQVQTPVEKPTPYKGKVEKKKWRRHKKKLRYHPAH